MGGYTSPGNITYTGVETQTGTAPGRTALLQGREEEGSAPHARKRACIGRHEKAEKVGDYY